MEDGGSICEKERYRRDRELEEGGGGREKTIIGGDFNTRTGRKGGGIGEEMRKREGRKKEGD